MGVPGCSMYMKTTILDAVLPRAFAGHTLTKADFVAMGEGGFVEDVRCAVIPPVFSAVVRWCAKCLHLH